MTFFKTISIEAVFALFLCSIDRIISVLEAYLLPDFPPLKTIYKCGITDFWITFLRQRNSGQVQELSDS